MRISIIIYLYDVFLYIYIYTILVKFIYNIQMVDVHYTSNNDLIAKSRRNGSFVG